MCAPATCATCTKTTWTGCGQHVDQVMRGVPKGQQCACSPAQRVVARKPSLLSRLFNR